MQDAIICDVDGTVALMKGKRSPFEYHKADKDEPNHPVISTVLTMKEIHDCKLIMLSARENVLLNIPSTDNKHNHTYVNEKYSDPNGVHHYEITQSSGDTSVKINVGTTNADYPTATAITNFEYEEKEQDKMRNIRILDPRYVGQLVTEYQSLIRESAI